MLQIIVGVPGSGKTYKAVNDIYEVFSDTKSKRFKENTHFFTNINEFRFDMFPDGVAFPLNYDDFYAKLTVLHSAATVLNYNDTQLKDEAKTQNLLGALVVIDEAQNYFDRDDKILVWWISYHRHLNQNIILLTQSLDLMNTKYKKFSESFLRAVPSSLRLFSSVFRYKRYIGARMYQKELVGTDKLKFNKDVYALYHSGANQQGQKVIWKFLGFAALALVALVLVFYMIFKKWSPDTDTNETNSTNTTAPAATAAKPIIYEVPKDYEDIRLLCGAKSCVFQGATLTNSDVENLKRKYQMKLLSMTPLTADFSVYVYRSKIGVKNEILAGFN